MPYQNINISIPGGIVSGKYQGGGQSTPILMLHGWLDNLESFSGLCRCFAELGISRPILLVDMPGHGKSFHHSDDSRFHFVDIVTDVIHIIEFMQWRKVILLGHSMGGAISSLIAATKPEMIESIISIEMLGPLSAPEESVVERLSEHINGILKEKGRLISYQTKDEAIKARSMVASPPIDLLEAMVERNLEANKDGFVWCTDRRLKLPTALRLTEPQVEQFLKAISCPVLYIEGEKGYQDMQKSSLLRAKKIKHLTQVKLPGGHHLHMEYPDLVAETIVEFLLGN